MDPGAAGSLRALEPHPDAAGARQPRAGSQPPGCRGEAGGGSAPKGTAHTAISCQCDGLPSMQDSSQGRCKCCQTPLQSSLIRIQSPYL
jgi:hypothetical protein